MNPVLALELGPLILMSVVTIVNVATTLFAVLPNDWFGALADRIF